MPRFLMHLAVGAISLGVTSWVLPGVHIAAIGSLLVAALVLAFLNTMVRPVLLLLTLPVTLLTLGIFYFVLNGLLFGLAAFLVPGFDVDGFGWAILGAIILGLFSAFLNAQLGVGSRRPTR